MLISSSVFQCSLHLILLLFSSVSVVIEKQCFTDDDCDLELECDFDRQTCQCPKPYFLREDLQACFGCPQDWIELETSKCLLFAIRPYPAVTWNVARSTCQDLHAQTMLIGSGAEFSGLQRKLEALLTETDASNGSLDAHQRVWVDIDQNWTESYVWCDIKRRESSDCVQIRWSQVANTICLEYKSCDEEAQFICEASPLRQFDLQRNLVDEKSSTDGESMLRLPPPQTAQSWLRALPKTTKKTVTAIKTTTKKSSGINVNNIVNTVNSGLSTFNQVSSFLGNLFSGGKNKNPQSNSGGSSLDLSSLQEPQALASKDDEESGTNWKMILIIGGLVVGGILLLVVCCLVFTFSKEKENKSTGRTSVQSEGSYVSTVSL